MNKEKLEYVNFNFLQYISIVNARRKCIGSFFHFVLKNNGFYMQIWPKSYWKDQALNSGFDFADVLFTNIFLEKKLTGLHNTIKIIKNNIRNITFEASFR